MTKIYAIRNKQSGEFLCYNSKCAWTKAGNAKNAWANANNGYGRDFVRFDDQELFEIVELTEVYNKRNADKQELASLRYQTGWKTGSNGR